MSGGNDDKLIRMANQIATFFESQPSVDPGEATAKHINDFWSPPMRGRLIELARGGAGGMRPAVLAGAAHVREPGERPDRAEIRTAGIPPTRLDDEGAPRDPAFASSGGSDAG